ncbi:hypothetical protein [Rhodobacter sp. 24-YEA-8]|uniref:hypothetical protein n=1 Tax=Rhodobacter sp. 24-YEA-8 TaxID=1884310 RepID=UPI0008978A3B|nr:hypothetical protein [Rhodobacter sp. 24-YEA-8]SEB58515.1 hypothetical protein SAMN05519105_0835 [Rhodobacter sp. 24-YEA-8]
MTRPLRGAALIAVLPLMLMPGLASARDCMKPKDTTASLCTPGAVWDEASGSCLIQPAS